MARDFIPKETPNRAASGFAATVVESFAYVGVLSMAVFISAAALMYAGPTAVQMVDSLRYPIGSEGFAKPFRTDAVDTTRVAEGDTNQRRRRFVFTSTIMSTHDADQPAKVAIKTEPADVTFR